MIIHLIVCLRLIPLQLVIFAFLPKPCNFCSWWIAAKQQGFEIGEVNWPYDRQTQEIDAAIGWQKIGNHFLKLPMDIINTSEHKKILYNNNNDSVV